MWPQMTTPQTSIVFNPTTGQAGARDREGVCQLTSTHTVKSKSWKAKWVHGETRCRPYRLPCWCGMCGAAPHHGSDRASLPLHHSFSDCGGMLSGCCCLRKAQWGQTSSKGKGHPGFRPTNTRKPPESPTTRLHLCSLATANHHEAGAEFSLVTEAFTVSLRFHAPHETEETGPFWGQISLFFVNCNKS